jgi:hypothetical protein
VVALTLVHTSAWADGGAPASEKSHAQILRDDSAMRALVRSVQIEPRPRLVVKW